ncbi:hypothetical protein R6Q57_013395 [Mikania cordata]
MADEKTQRKNLSRKNPDTQSTLCSYVVMTSHPIAFTLKTCKTKRIAMPWRTLNNFVDYGVFAMRHMETFKGTSVKEWKCGLTTSLMSSKDNLMM